MSRLRKTCLFVLLAALPLLAASYETKAVKGQVQVGRGRFNTPTTGQAMDATSPITVMWELDNPAEVAYQDLNLSTDGGMTFGVAIADHLSPTQRQISWSTHPKNATSRARLAITLHGIDGDISQILSDSFLISSRSLSFQSNISSSSIPDGSPAANATVPHGAISRSGVSSVSDINSTSIPSANENASEEPNFPGNGSCATWNFPNVTLDYNMGQSYAKCGSPPSTESHPWLRTLTILRTSSFFTTALSLTRTQNPTKVTVTVQ